jgi:hypothetical protein
VCEEHTLYPLYMTCALLDAGGLNPTLVRNIRIWKRWCFMVQPGGPLVAISDQGDEKALHRAIPQSKSRKGDWLIAP